MAHEKANTLFSSDISTPGYLQSVASSKKKSKETLRLDQLMPSEILEASDELSKLLKAYYTFMNLEEFIYQETKTFTDIVLDNKAVFRISDPNNENDEFFTDETGADSTLTVTDSDGNVTTIPLNEVNVSITNGNELPGSLAESTSEIGKTFTVLNLNSYNTYTATLTTIVKYWVGPGPSYVLNSIEEAMDIDANTEKYLELMQKEIAAVIPRDLTVNKRNLYKNIIDYYRVRGSSDSIEIFFRLLFNDNVEVTFPYDQTLIPSSGKWEVNPSLPKGGQYLDNKGFLSYNIKLQDSLRYQKFSYLIRTGKNISDWEDVFNRLVHPAGFKYFGEILILIELTKAVLGEDTTEGDTLNRFVLSAMPDRQPGAIGLEDLPVLVQMFASQFLPTTTAKIHKSATFSVNLSSNAVDSIDVVEPGWGYSVAPTITINGVEVQGQTISQATATATLDSNGRVESVTVTSGGANYATAFASASANPNAGSIANVIINGEADKQYRVPPSIVFPVPTAVDVDGNPLSTNVTAVAKFLLSPTTISTIQVTNGGSGYTGIPTVTISGNATAVARVENGKVTRIKIVSAGSGYTDIPTITISGGGGNGAQARAYLTASEIASVSITNAGSGYVSDPRIRIASSANNELRAKHIRPILILLLNQAGNLLKENNYFNRKGTEYYDSSKRYGFNNTIEYLGSQEIQSVDLTHINKYNVNSFIHLESL